MHSAIIQLGRDLKRLLIVATLSVPTGNAAPADFATSFSGVAGATFSQTPFASTFDSAGNTYFAGTLHDESVTIGSFSITKIGMIDTLVMKVDASGTVIWAKNFGGSGATAWGQSIALDSAGQIYIGGFFHSGNLTVPAMTRLGVSDAYVMKLDGTGSVLWARQFGGIGASAKVSSIAVSASDNVHVVGGFEGADLTTPALSKIGSEDTFAIKLDGGGNTIWSKNFGGAGGAKSYGKTVAIDASGNVYVGANFEFGNLTTPSLSRIGTVDALVLKLNSAGNMVWSRNFGGPGTLTYGTGIAVDNSGNVHLCGYFYFGNLSTPPLTRLGTHDAFAIKLDSNGGQTWSRNFGGAGAETRSHSISVDTLGNVVLGGRFGLANLTAPSLTRIGTEDAFVLRLDNGGNGVWERNFGGSGAKASVETVKFDVTGNVNLAGYFENAKLTTPPLQIVGTRDEFSFKLSGSGNTTQASGVGRLSGGGSIVVSATAVDATGSVYITGTFDSRFVSFGGVKLTKLGVIDAFVAKLSGAGDVLWAKNFGGKGALTYANGISTEPNGSLYVGGTFLSANLTNPPLTQIGDTDAFVFKLDSAGNHVWSRSFGGLGASARGFGIAIDAASNVYLGGYFENGNLTMPALTKIGGADAFAIKLDSAASTVWSRNYGGSGTAAYGFGIAVDASGNAYLAGYFFGNNMTTPALTRIGTDDAFALKLDSDGSTVWSRNFGGTGARTTGKGVAVDSIGNVYLGGYFESANLTTPALAKIGFGDAFAFKLDGAGNSIWSKTFGGSGTQVQSHSIFVDAADNVYLCGWFGVGNLNTPALVKIGGADAFALKFNSAGNSVWAKNFGGAAANAQSNGIAVDAGGNAYLGGDFSDGNLTTPSLKKAGYRDAFLIKANSSIAGVHTRKVHGNTGPFNIAIDTFQPITGPVTVEPRMIGSGHTIVFQFDSTVTSPGTVSVSPVGSASLLFSGKEVFVNLTEIPDNQRVTISLSNVNGTINPPAVSMGFLVGDVNNSRLVSASDISTLKARSGQTVDESKFKLDLDASGTIGASDVTAAKARSGQRLAP